LNDNCLLEPEQGDFFFALASDRLGMENLAPQGFPEKATEMKEKNQMG
jgi:hypothetical protein